MRIAFRTDASMTRGSGHVMRCLCLANELSRLGHSITFASIDLPDYLHTLVTTHGHAVVALPNQGQSDRSIEESWSDAAQQRDADATAMGDDLLVLDHYGLGEPWERAVRRNGHPLMVIDDLGRQHVCDLLLDQNFYRTPETRYAGKLPKNCRQLIGPRFALMRAEFAAARRTPRDGEVQCILVFVGGMDAGDVTSHILRALNEGLSGRPAINVAIGANHPQRAAIQAHCAAMDDWTCHVQTNHMAHLLAAADLVIGSGGTNTWERMTVGVPALALCIAENQRALLDECAATGLLNVPDDDALNDVALLRMHVNSMLKNQRQRHHFAVAGMALVDGLGTARVARAVAMLQSVIVRPATAADSDMLLAWRNHDSIRAVSRSKETIGRDAHRNWYERVLADPTRSLLVGECDRRPIGCVRFDEKDPDSAEISIFVAPDAIGTGAGTNLLAAAETWLERNRPHVARIDAEVLGGNVASTRLFERAGYQLDDVRYSKGLHI